MRLAPPGPPVESALRRLLENKRTRYARREISVYASQWPLPDTTARHGSRLARLYRGRHLRRQSSTRFARRKPAQIRASGIPASFIVRDLHSLRSPGASHNWSASGHRADVTRDVVVRRRRHSISSSARTSNEGGTARPSAFGTTTRSTLFGLQRAQRTRR
jgi:hypothetical protein